MKHKHLSHIDLPNTYQFITFRTHDSMDAFLRKLANAQVAESRKQLQMDAYLDESVKGAYLYGEVLEYFIEYLHGHDGELYQLVAFAVMANHVHLLIKPLLPLAEVLKTLKGRSAKQMNEMLGRRGKFWAKDYFDRGIRDERHFGVVYRYIRNNPLKLHDYDREDGLRFYGIYGDDV